MQASRVDDNAAGTAFELTISLPPVAHRPLFVILPSARVSPQAFAKAGRRLRLTVDNLGPKSQEKIRIVPADFMCLMHFCYSIDAMQTCMSSNRVHKFSKP